MFPFYVQNPKSFQSVEAHSVPSLKAFARLADAVPAELLILDPTSYAGVVASVAYLQALADAFQSSMTAIPLNLSGYDRNPIALIRDAMANCPDQAPTQETTALSFITDPELRENI